MFSENLRYLRKQAQHSQEYLAKQLNYKSFTTIQKWEDGTSKPSYAVIAKIANIYNVSVNDMMEKDLTIQIPTVPILGTVRGGEPIYAQQQIQGYEPVELQETNNGEYFYLEVVGDSMKDDRILPGDILYVRKQNTLNNGEIGIVLVDDEATVKRVYFKNNTLILQPSNDSYQPLVFDEQQLQQHQVQILGKVIHNKIRY
ncbi:MAG: helix-turn-helix domain-containing protein [Erysipelotrichaceae bacterium]|nr:helix-turn-helix domain-containing protein [Erysipelotrichaceae bacterium]